MASYKECSESICYVAKIEEKIRGVLFII